MPHIPMEYTVDLGKTINVTPLHTLFAMGDDNAHRFAFSIVHDGKPVDLSGCTVLATYTNFSPHGVTVNLGGKIEDGKAVALLNKACYTMEGRFALVVRLKNSDGTSAIFYGDGYMSRTTSDTVIDGDYMIYDVNTLLEKIAEINEATSSANTAAQNANTAAETANAAAGNANTEAQNANTAANAANASAQTADAAAVKIDAMTVSATPLDAGTASAALTLVDGHYHLTLGLPKGDTGATPQISVQVATGAAGSEASVSVSGTAEEPVIHLTIPRGETGRIENLTINGKPVESGTITLTPGDLGAASAQEVSQLKDDLAAEQTARVEGLAEKLGKTETAADSAKLGGKAPEYYIQPRNLLDNSDFTNPVNQRGQMSYNSVGYTIDRWTKESNAILTIADDCINIDNSANSADEVVLQKVDSDTAAKLIGKTVTIAICTSDGTVYAKSGVVTYDVPVALIEHNGFTFQLRFFRTASSYQVARLIILAGSNISVKWAALYEGSYTADTLPPYVPKGYAAELAECQRYYKHFVNNAFLGTAIVSGDGVLIQGFMPLDTPMRINNPAIIGTLAFYESTQNQALGTPTTFVQQGNGIRCNFSLTTSLTAKSAGFINTLGEVGISADL